MVAAILWLVVGGRGWLFNLVIPINVNKTKSMEEIMLKSTDNGHLIWMFVLCLVKKFG